MAGSYAADLCWGESIVARLAGLATLSHLDPTRPSFAAQRPNPETYQRRQHRHKPRPGYEDSSTLYPARAMSIGLDPAREVELRSRCCCRMRDAAYRVRGRGHPSLQRRRKG